MRKIKAAALIFVLFSSPLLARYDDYRDYRQTYQPAYQVPIKIEPPPQNKFVNWFKDLFQGAVKGDSISKPTVLNVVGQISTGFTPAGPVADIRDLAINAYRSGMTGFKEHKVDMGLAAAGIIPAVSEIRKVKAIYKAEKQAVMAERAFKAAGYFSDMSLVRKSLPALKAGYAAEFEGMARLRTFKPGDKIFRSPPSAQFENALTPGQWFGTRLPSTSKGADSMYQSAKYGNKNELVRTYEFKQNVTVYYGKVKGGTGYQVCFPDDVNPGSVLNWTDMRRLR